MAKDSYKRERRKRPRKGLPRKMNFPDASHPIFSNPTVIGSRANLMRSMSKAVDASEEAADSPSTHSSNPSVEPEVEETEEDDSRGEPGSGGAA